MEDASHSRQVTGGVDTHKDSHAVAAIDQVGGVLGRADFPAHPRGYADLLAWLRGFGELVQVGVEGTGSYGAGLARYLRANGVNLVEVDRPDRRTRRRRGKSDPIDAEAAARAALSGVAGGVPKTGTGPVERGVRGARRGCDGRTARAHAPAASLSGTISPLPIASRRCRRRTSAPDDRAGKIFDDTQIIDFLDKRRTKYKLIE